VARYRIAKLCKKAAHAGLKGFAKSATAKSDAVVCSSLINLPNISAFINIDGSSFTCALTAATRLWFYLSGRKVVEKTKDQ